MALDRMIVFMLLAGCSAAQAVSAQADAAGERRWTIRASYAVPLPEGFNVGSLKDFLDDNGFGHNTSGLFGGTDFPTGRFEGGYSALAAYAYRPQLSVGGAFHRAADVWSTGNRTGSGRITLHQTMWAVAPVALWRPTRALALGAGPAFIRARTTLLDDRSTEGERTPPQEQSFVRVGAVAFASLGFGMFDRSLYVGLEGRLLYGGVAEVGPYVLHESSSTLGPRGIRLSQLTLGPVVALSF